MHAVKLTLAAAALATLTSGAVAKDWIQSVEVKRDGIDVVPIEVSANKTGYTGIKSNSHRFLLRLHAKAKSSKRIVAMKLGSFQGVLYFEASPGLWSKSFAHRDVGSGTKRTVTFNYKPVVPMGKIRWHGKNPKAACNARLAQEMQKGLTKSQALSKVLTTSAKAYFELDAVAAKKQKAVKNKWNIGNTTNQRDGATYQVQVKCLAGVKKAPAKAFTN
jgi:hypothetical protein